jgi:hypothetical protein
VPEDVLQKMIAAMPEHVLDHLKRTPDPVRGGTPRSSGSASRFETRVENSCRLADVDGTGTGVTPTRSVKAPSTFTRHSSEIACCSESTESIGRSAKDSFARVSST